LTTPTFQPSEAAALARGCDEVVERRRAPLAAVPTHTHPFADEALVVQGQMWLTVGGATREVGPGDTFELAMEAPHAEHHGREGATYWATRRAGKNR
jgi:mannose-6-phosphate isomerase-like protein (cupin superfamily)